MKKVYKKPKSLVVTLTDNLMGEVITPGSPTDDFSKENTINFEDSDGNSGTTPKPINLWDE